MGRLGGLSICALVASEGMGLNQLWVDRVVYTVVLFADPRRSHRGHFHWRDIVEKDESIKNYGAAIMIVLISALTRN